MADAATEEPVVDQQAEAAQAEGNKDDDQWGDWKKDEWKENAAEVVEEEPKETVADVNAKSSNTDLMDGGIKVDDAASFQCRLMNGPISSASGAWLEVHDIPNPKTGRPLPGKIFTLAEDQGSAEQRERAQKYARLALASKGGWTASLEATDDKDLCVMSVPEEARDKIIGRTGVSLVELSQQKSVCIFAIDDGNSAAPVVVNKAPEPWLAIGSRVEMLSKGDVRFVKWVAGTIKEIASQQRVSVKLDSGAEHVVEWWNNLRPQYEVDAAVEVHSEVPPAEDAEEGTSSTWEWMPASFSSWDPAEHPGLAAVKLAGKEESMNVEQKHVRMAGLVQEESTNEETAKPPIRLAIFGEQRGRIEAVLSIMSTVDWLSPGFFDAHPAPLPPAVETATPDQDAETWFSTAFEINGNADAVKKNLDQIQKACGWKAIIELSGSTARILGSQVACRLARAIVNVAAAADRSEVEFEHAPSEDVDAFLEKVPMPGDLVPFVAGKQRNRLNELEAAEDVIVFFLRHPLPEKVEEVEEATEEKKEDGNEEATEEKKEDGEAAEEDPEKTKEKVPEEGEAETADAAATTEGDAAKEWDNKDWKDNSWNDKSWEKKEWDKPAQEEKGKVEILIFAIDDRARLRARLALTRTVESKAPGHVLGYEIEPCTCLEDKVTIDILDFAEEHMGWLSGKQGTNKKRIAAASGCGMEYSTHYVYLAGTGAERARARQYLDWLLLQKPDRDGGGARTGQREIPLEAKDLESRDDYTIMMLTPDEKESIIKELGDLEEETKTFMVIQHKPDAEFFAAGEKMSITRGGRTFFIEINEAPAGEEMIFSCKLLAEDPWIDEDEASKVPLMIFGADEWQRSEGEKKVREAIDAKNAPEAAWGEEDTAQEWNAGGSNSWDKPKADSWDKPKTDSWDKPAADSWGGKEECGDFKKGRCTRGDSCKFSHDIPGMEDTPQEWNGKAAGGDDWGAKAANSWDKPKPAADAWGSEAKSWEKPKPAADAWGSDAKSWDKPAPEEDSWSKWGANRR